MCNIAAPSNLLYRSSSVTLTCLSPVHLTRGRFLNRPYDCIKKDGIAAVFFLNGVVAHTVGRDCRFKERARCAHQVRVISARSGFVRGMHCQLRHTDIHRGDGKMGGGNIAQRRAAANIAATIVANHQALFGIQMLLLQQFMKKIYIRLPHAMIGG